VFDFDFSPIQLDLTLSQFKASFAQVDNDKAKYLGKKAPHSAAN
jgi:hypothetical protein